MNTNANKDTKLTNSIIKYILLAVLLLSIVLICYYAAKSTVFPTTNSESEVPALLRSDIPRISIVLKDGELSTLYESKENVLEGGMEVFDKTGRSDSKSSAKIHCRGYSSFNFTSDKSFNVNLSGKTKILDLPKSKKYVLIAYAFDKTHIRNVVTYSLSDMLNQKNTPQVRLVDLYINNTYLGLYGITPAIDSYETWSDSKNEKILFVTDRPEEKDDYLNFSDNRNRKLVFKYPRKEKPEKYEVIKEDIIPKLNKINDILRSSYNSIDCYDKLCTLVDMDSFENMFILNFIVQNPDANRYSTYFYFDSNGVLHTGPPWDYDIALGSDYPGCFKLNTYMNGIPEQLFLCSSVFRDEVYQKVKSIDSMDRKLLKKVDEYSSEIHDSLISDLTSNGYYSDVSSAESGLNEDMEALRQMITNRYSLLIDILEHYDEYLNVSAGGQMYGCSIWVKKGDSFSEEEYTACQRIYGETFGYNIGFDKDYIFEDNNIELLWME